MPLNLFSSLRPWNRATVLRDAVAGVSLASMNVPQVLGYTRIAGTPVVTGLYTLLLPLVAFAIFGSSRQLVVAADSATAAIFASGLSGMAPTGTAQYMALVGVVALITAALLLVARLFRLGFLSDFLSRTVLVGFLAGVGVQVGVAVLGEMLGVTITTHRTVEQIAEIFRDLPRVNGMTLGLSGALVACLLVAQRWAPRVPVSLIAVVAGIAASAMWDWSGRGIAVIGPVPSGLPSLALPRVGWDEITRLLPIAVSCFVIIIAQSAATSRVFALRHHERVDADADILGLAAANAAAAISGTFVVNGSLTQTAMAERAGAQSQVAQLVAAVVVVFVLLFLTGPLQYLPRFVLAAIVFNIAIGLIDRRGLAEILRESPGEFVLAIGTALTVALVGLEQGILLAVGLSLLRHVRQSYRPHTSVLAPGPTGRWVPVSAVPGVQTEPGLIVYHFGADLFYANANLFTDEMRGLIAHAPSPVRWLVIDAGAITAIDFSAARAVHDLCDDLSSTGVNVAFGRVNAYLRGDMDRHRISDVIGHARIFSTMHEAVDLALGSPAGGNSGARDNHGSANGPNEFGPTKPPPS